MAKIKINTKKFIRNIIICVVAVIIVAFILNVAPGFRRDKYNNVVNLVLNEKNITEELKNNIYISEKGTIYLSEEDIMNLFDPYIYYDKKYNQIITTSNTKVANIVINEKKITINDITQSMLEPVIKINDKIYLPISDMNLVYNIDVKYIESTNVVIIDDLNKGLIRADVAQDTKIKYKPRALSKSVGEVKKGDTISCFYTTSKGWTEIRTEDGIVGYIKANKITNHSYVRQDMEPKEDATEISLKKNSSGQIAINEQKYKLIDLYNIEDAEGSDDSLKICGNLSTKGLNIPVDELLADFKARTAAINEIVNTAIQKRVSNLNLDFTGAKDENAIKRFAIEISPKLREMGITTSVVLNDNVNKDDFYKIVDYIVTER